MELEDLKIYIRIHLKTKFIQSLKYPVGVLIIVNKKPDGNVCLYGNYHDLNNLTIND